MDDGSLFRVNYVRGGTETLFQYQQFVDWISDWISDWTFQIGLSRLARIALAGLSFSIQWTTRQGLVSSCDFKNDTSVPWREKNTTTIIYFLARSRLSQANNDPCHCDTRLHCFSPVDKQSIAVLQQSSSSSSSCCFGLL
jgi:hypothetical protein